MAHAAFAHVGAAAERASEGSERQTGSDAFTWRRAHEELVRLAAKRAGLDFEEGCWLLRALRSGAHLRMGYGSFHEYSERLFGYSPRVTQEKLRVAQSLEDLPRMTSELREGRITFSAARELTRVATRRTENEWLEAIRNKTARDIERLVSGHQPGSRPYDPVDTSAKRHVLRLEISGEALATFREAMAKIRRDAGESLDDDAAVLLLARHVLAGPKEQGRASYQVALTVCERCQRGEQEGRGELVEVPREVTEMAACDGQNIGHVGESAHVGERAAVRRRATQSIPSALRRAVLRRDAGRCRVPGCRHATFVDVHHLVPRADGGANVGENLVTLCSAHHRAVHRGELIAEGTAGPRLRFAHADGIPYGVPSCSPTEMRVAACRALRLMGFRDAEAERAVARAEARSAGRIEDLIRQSLRELLPRDSRGA